MSDWGNPRIRDTGRRLDGSMNALALEAIRRDDERETLDARGSDLQYRRDMARNMDEFHHPDLAPTKIDYLDGDADGGLGARPAYYDPRSMDPIANRERARQTRDQGARQEEGLAQDLQPLEDMRNAATLRMKGRTLEDVKDYGQSLQAKRYWDPMTHSAGEEEFGRKSFLATEPARVAGDARVEEALAEERARVEAARLGRPDPTTQALGLIPKVQAGGGFGVDGKGNAMPPPSNLQQGTVDALTRMMGGAQPKLAPEVEAEIQRGLSMGVAGPSGAPATRDEIIAHLKALGRIK